MNINDYISSGIIESYVLGLASPEEAREVEAMAAGHAEVREAIAACRKTLDDYGALHAVQPPPALKAKVMDALRREGENATVIKGDRIHPAATGTVIQSRRLWKWLPAAAAVLLIASLALNSIYIGKYYRYRHQYEQLILRQQELLTQNQAMQTRIVQVEQGMQVLMNPAMKPVVMQGVKDHPAMTATVYWDPQSRHTYLAASNLPVPPAGMVYQLWAIVDGKPTDMGLYDPSRDKGPLAMKNAVPGTVQAFAITLEKQGGSPVPTMSRMYVMGKI